MFRYALHELMLWKESSSRLPLLLRGARQVGKSWLVRELGKTFSSFVEINFEKNPQLASLFEGDLEITSLLEKLSIIAKQKIISGETLLFLDEIQECPRAITALRYFKEECPELHVIAAGSLIEFALESIGLPVGRVEFLYVYPLSFQEFLMAQKREDLCEYIDKKDIDPVIHEQLLDQVKTYFWLGGMPAVVELWLEKRDALLCQQLQDNIIQAYKQDFLKYAKPSELVHLALLVEAIPKQLGKKFKYSTVDSSLRSEPLKKSLNALCKAGIVTKVHHSSGQGFPLSATQKLDHFKIFFFDIGLAQRLLGLELDKWLTQKLAVQHIGAIAEQFVAQEYVAYSSARLPAQLFYWHREARTSNAEVDFLFVKDHCIIPVEVKAGLIGTLKSMLFFLHEHPQSPYGLRISERNFSMYNEGKVESIPFYGIKTWLASPEKKS